MIDFLHTIFNPKTILVENMPTIPLLMPKKVKRSISIKRVSDIVAAGYKTISGFKSMPVRDQHAYLDNIGSASMGGTKAENLENYKYFLRQNGL